MTIDGTDILATYGLKLIKLEDYFNLPARKKTLNITGTDEKDIVHEAGKATVTLKGVYSSSENMIAQKNAFETALKSPLKHAVNITEHGLSFNATAAAGFEATPYWRFNAMILKITFTIVG